jgi:hypothetical protein
VGTGEPTAAPGVAVTAPDGSRLVRRGGVQAGARQFAVDLGTRLHAAR